MAEYRPGDGSGTSDSSPLPGRTSIRGPKVATGGCSSPPRNGSIHANGVWRIANAHRCHRPRMPARTIGCRGTFFKCGANLPIDIDNNYMNTPRVNWNPPLTRHLAEHGAFSESPFHLVDVGASGGIDEYWKVLGNSPHATGFDCLSDGVARLNATAGPNERYHACLVGKKGFRPPTGVAATFPLKRTSAVRALELLKPRLHKDISGPYRFRRPHERDDRAGSILPEGSPVRRRLP